jgi:thiamine-phosphate pyrophosphorylase
MSEGRTDVTAARRARIARVAGLYAVTPDSGDTALLVRVVAAAIDGGAAVVQYRNKSADPATRTGQAIAIATLARRRGTLFIVNDDVDVAVRAGADGVHVGDDDPPLAFARERLGADRLIGVSCYDDFERARSAVAAGADYVAFGSFFASATKPGARRADPDVLRRATTLGVPVVAIGGITSSNARQLVDAGATAVAVISDVFGPAGSERISAAAAAIAGCFGERSRPSAKAANR